MLRRNLKVFGFLVLLFLVLGLVTGCGSGGGTTTEEPAGEEPAGDESAAPAGAFPEKPITLVIPFGAGGSHDAHARIIERFADKHLGVPLIIELQPGGSGAVASNYVARVNPDGYVLLFGSNGCNTVLPLTQELPYSREDFIPIAKINHSASIIVTRAELWKTIEELIEDAKARPGEISFASSGMFNAGHIAFELFQSAADIQLNHVPMEGGAEPQMALMGGQVPLCGAFADEIIDLIGEEEGDLRPLAVTSTERIEGFEDVPALAELGYGVEWNMWRTVLAPKGTPQEIVDYLEAGFRGICEDPEFIDLVQKMGEDVYYMGSEEFAAYWEAEEESFRGVFGDIEKE